MVQENAQKIKLLKIMELLQTETDEKHPISRMDLCRRMEGQGIPCSARTLIEDIETLNNYGYDVKRCQIGHQRGYYVPQRAFSTAELKILIDAVQAAGFISEGKTAELVVKLAALGGSHRVDLLKSNLVQFNTRKHSNEAVCENVAKLEEALRQQCKASFCYFSLNEHAERVYRRDHARYLAEPVSLVFDSGYYYLLGYTTDPTMHNGFVTYRIDRMDDVRVETEKICKAATEQRKKIKGYTSRAIRMYSGHEEKVLLEFDDSVIGAVFDRFGEKIRINRINDNTCSVVTKVQMSPTFRAWVYQFGDLMRMVEPQQAAIKETNHNE